MIFQFPIIVIATASLSLVNIVLFSIANIFFILVGAKYFEKRDKINVSQYFILLGAINILWNVISLSLPDFIPLLSLSISESYMYMLYFIYTPAFLLELLTFGVLLILVASKNEERDGNILSYAGISSIIYTILSFMATFIMYSSLSLGSYPDGLMLVIMGILNIISIIFRVSFNILIILYSIRLNELYLKIPAYLLLIITLITIITMILPIF